MRREALEGVRGEMVVGWVRESVDIGRGLELGEGIFVLLGWFSGVLAGVSAGELMCGGVSVTRLVV